MTRRAYKTKIITQQAATEQQLKRLIDRAGGFEIVAKEDNQRPDLLIYEVTGDTREAFDLIRTLLETGQVGAVFLTSTNIDTTILLQAFQTGISGFLTQPLEEGEVVSALNKFKRKLSATEQPQSRKKGRIVYLLGSKGGAGTTTLAVNMATLLMKPPRKQSAVLLDMNMLFGDIPLFLDLKYSCHLTEVINNMDRLDLDFLNTCLTKHSSGLNVLPAPQTLNGQRMPTPETMERILTLLSSMFDFVIVDGGKNLDTVNLEIMGMAADILLVTRLDLPALANTKKLINFLRFNKLANGTRMKVVVTQQSRKSQVSLTEAEEALTEDIFWVIPEDEKVCLSALNQGQPIGETAPRSKIGRNISQLCENILSQISAETG